jgi:DUF1680 family protein
VKVNGIPVEAPVLDRGYISLHRTWKKGDMIDLVLPMDVQLIESHPLVEENRNQVAVKRGPLVYCMESPDLPGNSIFEVIIPSGIRLHPVLTKVQEVELMALEGTAYRQNTRSWEGTLYRPASKADSLTEVEIRLIPYFAWGNRGRSEMSVWMPVNK